MMIYELSPSRFNDVAGLFEGSWAHIALIDAVLEGKRTGRIFVDDAQHPTSCLLCEASDNYFLFGDTQASPLRQFIKDTPSEAEVFDLPNFAYFLMGDTWVDALVKGHEDTMEFFDVRTFKFRKTSIEPIGNWRESLPKNGVVKRINRELVDSIDKKLSTFIGNCWGSNSRFIEEGFGFCTIIDDAIACVAWSFAVSSRYAEIFSETAKPFRCQGLATLTSFAFIEHCLALGLIPIWACQSSNPASVATAHKLGFEEGPVQRESNWRPYGANFKSSQGMKDETGVCYRSSAPHHNVVA